MRLDGVVILNYDDIYTRNTSQYLNFGFGARTGSSTNIHYIKGLLVTKLGTATNQYFIDNVSPLASSLYWENPTGTMPVGTAANGELGIDTSTPTATLDVNGSAALQNSATTDLLYSDATNNVIDIGGLPTPTGLTATLTTGGSTLVVGDYYYFRVAAIDAAGGESSASPEVMGGLTLSGSRTYHLSGRHQLTRLTTMFTLVPARVARTITSLMPLPA